MNLYAVIMAGGVGSRLWPRSRERSPKQLLHVIGDGTMIQNTIARLQPMVPYENIFIVTNRAQIEAFREQVPQVPARNLIAEPFGRNTAPCIALASVMLEERDPNGVMLVLPADHFIENVREFQQQLKTACDAAYETGGLVTMGITPTRPETGYGYIQVGEPGSVAAHLAERGVRRVLTFAEKPDLPTAERFLASGDFLWNSGMFIWRVDAIAEALQTYLPELHEQVQTLRTALGTTRFGEVLESVYSQIHPISIDYGVMEKARNALVIRCDFGWSDVGSWDETYRLARKDDDGNSIVGDVVTVGTTGSFIRTSGRMIATVGVEDLIIVDTPDALLVCRRGDSQRVQAVVDYLRRKKISSLL
jgi:mannose-1-phosphate guanylyltransferase